VTTPRATCSGRRAVNLGRFRGVRGSQVLATARPVGAQAPSPRIPGPGDPRIQKLSLVGIEFFGSKQFRSAQCCISFVRESKSAGAPSLMSNFGRAAAVEISQICFGLPPAPSFLWAIRSIPSFGIAKFAASRLASRYQQKYQQSGPLQWAFAWIFNPPRQFSWEIRNRTSALSYYYC
jgi:hypothetical protein